MAELKFWDFETLETFGALWSQCCHLPSALFMFKVVAISVCFSTDVIWNLFASCKAKKTVECIRVKITWIFIFCILQTRHSRSFDLGNRSVKYKTLISRVMTWFETSTTTEQTVDKFGGSILWKNQANSSSGSKVIAL